MEDDYAGYLAVIREDVRERYREPGKLHSAKATEWHRISLAVLAAGGDPTDMGTDDEGNRIDLIADGTYDRGKTASLGRQGINGWIWGLIALDSLRYDIPEGSYYSREDLITEILCRQLADGGFALTGSASDPDMTAMAVQALAPYYNGEQTYTYRLDATGETVTQTVRQAVEEALACLSAAQLDGGDFESWGTQNVESTAQVVVALCSLGIDPQTDARFIKSGHTLVDGMLRYRQEDGGFAHSYIDDPDNPSAPAGQSNSMAGEQALYALAALCRQQAGQRTLYDFRPEQGEELKSRLAAVSGGIAALTGMESREELTALLASYYALPETERCYVDNYHRLSAAASAAGIDVADYAGASPVVREQEQEGGAPLVAFTAEDRQAADSLPSPLTTEQYVTVVKLLAALEQSENFDGKEIYREKLTAAKAEIDGIRAEIDALNADILKQLYPFESLSLWDKGTVDRLTERYEALSPYDRQKVANWDDVVKSKTKIDNQLRAVIIAAVLAAAAIVLTVVLVKRFRKRLHRRERELEELAASYTDEE